jgi:hypothetical protein
MNPWKKKPPINVSHCGYVAGNNIMVIIKIIHGFGNYGKNGAKFLD